MLKPLVLVVDASADTRLLYRMVLEASGWRVEEAANGRDALERALKRSPAAVVTEAVLPILDGCDLCARLRASPQTQQSVIIVVTGDTRLRARARAAGANAAELKPYLPSDLVEQVKKFLL